MSNSNYIIEDNIDFYSELHKSLDVKKDKDEDNDEDKEEKKDKQDEDNEKTDSNTCLISDCKLTDYFVQLECGHKFNYIPLYRDAINHKNKFNLMESSRSRVGINEIRCPYCRHIHHGVLPYHKQLKLAKIKGINTYLPINTSMCQFNMSNMNRCYRLIDYNDPCTKLSAKYKDIDNASYCYRHKCFMTDYYESITPKNVCNALLKSGSRKGQVCGCAALPPAADKCGKHAVK